MKHRLGATEAWRRAWLLAVLLCTMLRAASGHEFEAGGIVYRTTGEGPGRCEVARYDDTVWDVVEVPDSVEDDRGTWHRVTAVGDSAFRRCSALREVQLPASVTAVGENAFEGCASLRRLRLETAQGKQGAGCIEIYFPPAGEDDRSAAALRARYMDCIRGNRRDALFDFAQYDSLFPAISSPGDKVLVAVDRLKSARQLTPEHREQYLAYLRGAARQTVEIVVSHDDLAGLNTLAQLGIFTGENIDACIELANTARRPEVLSFLINYKNAAIGMDQTDYEL